MLLGVAREKITPEIGACIYGYRPDQHSDSVEDDLTAIAFYFEERRTRALLVCIMVCLLNTELSDGIRRRVAQECGIPFENIMLSATHTHSGPNTAGAYGWGDLDRDYCDGILIPAILSAAKRATEAPVEVEMGVGVGVSDIGVNRREITEDGRVKLGQNPWGCYDPQMTVIAFRDAEHRPVANLVHYGMHGTCAGISPRISRDWSGIMCDALEKASGAPTAFAVGPEGDVGPRLTNRKTVGHGDFAFVYEVGNRAAFDAVGIYRGIREYRPTSRLDVMQSEMALPLDRRCDAARAREMLAEYEGKTVNIDGSKRLHFERVLRSYDEGYEETAHRRVPHNFLVLDGRVALVGFPYELFSEIGLRIAKFSPFAYTLSLACTNGSESYFAAETDICRGGYEIDSFLYADIQPFVKNADFYLINETLKDLKTLCSASDGEDT